MKNYKTIIAVVAGGLVCTAVSSKATLTPLTQNGHDTAIDNSVYIPLGGSIIDSLTSAYSVGSSPDAGTLTTQVYQTAGTGSALDFIYTLNLTSGYVKGITVDGFSGAVSVSNTGSPAASLLITTASYDHAGDISVGWDGDYAAAQTISFIVTTTATGYEVQNAGVLDGTTANVPIYSPVPESTTLVAGVLMLLPLGIGAARSLRKDRGNA